MYLIQEIYAEHYDRETVMELFGISSWTLRDSIKKKILPDWTFQFSNKVFWKKAKIDSILAAERALK